MTKHKAIFSYEDFILANFDNIPVNGTILNHDEYGFGFIQTLFQEYIFTGNKDIMEEKRNGCKLLLLLEILRHETNDVSGITAQQMVYRLRDFGYTTDSRSVSEYIRLLNYIGYGVRNRFVGHSKVYYIPEHRLALTELKLLTDQIRTSYYIPEEREPEAAKQLLSHLISLSNQVINYECATVTIPDANKNIDALRNKLSGLIEYFKEEAINALASDIDTVVQTSSYFGWQSSKSSRTYMKRIVSGVISMKYKIKDKRIEDEIFEVIKMYY